MGTRLPWSSPTAAPTTDERGGVGHAVAGSGRCTIQRVQSTHQYGAAGIRARRARPRKSAEAGVQLIRGGRAGGVSGKHDRACGRRDRHADTGARRLHRDRPSAGRARCDRTTSRALAGGRLGGDQRVRGAPRWDPTRSVVRGSHPQRDRGGSPGRPRSQAAHRHRPRITPAHPTRRGCRRRRFLRCARPASGRRSLGAGDHGHQQQGRQREDDDDGQPGRCVRRTRLARARGRPRPAGLCDRMARRRRDGEPGSSNFRPGPSASRTSSWPRRRRVSTWYRPVRASCHPARTVTTKPAWPSSGHSFDCLAIGTSSWSTPHRLSAICRSHPWWRATGSSCPSSHTRSACRAWPALWRRSIALGSTSTHASDCSGSSPVGSRPPSMRARSSLDFETGSGT